MNEAIRAALVEKAKREKARRAGTKQSSLPPEVIARLEAAKAGTLEVSPARLAEQAEIDKRVEQDLRDPGAFAALGLGFGQGATFGLADEAVAGLRAITSDRTYDEEIRNTRGQFDNARFSRPVTTAAGEVVGAVLAPGLGSAGAVGRGATVGRKMIAGAAAGAASGGLYGFGTGEGGLGPRANSAAQGAALGAVVGGAIPAVGAGLRRGAERFLQERAIRQAIAAADDPAQVRAAASRLYAQADQATNLPRSEFARTVGDIADAAERKGIDADLTPGAARVASRLDDAAQSADPTIGFREVDILRRKAGVPAGNVANRTEQSIASDMIEGIDNFIDRVDPNLSGVVKEARDMWGKLRRVEAVEGAIEKARNAASGFENGLRVEFRRILNNPKLRRGFTEAELDAITQVVRGTKTGNLMRQLGRVGLGLSGQSNGLGAAVGAGLGGALGGPVGALAVPAIGTAMKAGAERTTRAAAERALGVVAARNALAALPQTSLPMIEGAVNALSFGALPSVTSEGRAMLQGAGR